MNNRKSYYNEAFGSKFVDPVSGMQSTIYPPIPFKNTAKASNVSSNIIDMPTNKNKLGGWFGDNFGWSKSAGVKAFGKPIGKYATGANAVLQGFDAINNMNALSDVNADTDALISDILRSAASNPLTSNYLTSDQQSMLNQLKRGTLDTESGFLENDLMSLLGGAGQGALTGGLIGGIPGAVVGGLGGLVNTGLQGQAQAQSLTNSELEGLLQALTDAEMQYKSMKRPNFTGLGIQQQYKDMYR